MKLYAHPFSSYCQKVLIALYENAIPYELRMLGPGHDDVAAKFAALWPLKRMPILVDDGRTIVEATIIGFTLWIVGGSLVAPVMMLTVLGAFVPIVGAATAGVVAVLVALVTAGTGPAIVVAIVVLIVPEMYGLVVSGLPCAN